MKKILYKLLLLLPILFFNNKSTFAQAPNWQWAKSAGGTSDDIGNNIIADAKGNLYVTGLFNSDTIIFGNVSLTSNGFIDIFIAKYDTLGNVLWAKSGGGVDNDFITGIAVDDIGNFYITGYFDSPTIAFDTIVLTNSGGLYSDIFIVKYDSLGNVAWAKCAGGNNVDEGTGITSDRFGNIYLTGIFNSATINFDNTVLSNLSGPIFIVKYNSSGNMLWAKNEGGTGYGFGKSITVGANGNFYITGGFTSSTISFDSLNLTNANTAGLSPDIFLVKHDSSGNVLWAKRAGGMGTDHATSLSLDANDNAYITGLFNTIFSFNTLIIATVGFEDIYILKFDSSGHEIWAKSAGGGGYDAGNDLKVDSNGNSYLTGFFQSDSISFGSITLTNSDNTNNIPDVFIAKYDNNGNILWAKSAGGTNWDDGSGIYLGANGELYITGSFRGTSVSFDNSTLTNAGSNTYDFFVAKLDTVFSTSISKHHDHYNPIIIFPNPNNGYCTVTAKEFSNSILILFDITGRIFLEQKFNQQTELDLSHFENALYFVEIINKEGKISTGKIIKQGNE